MVFGVSSVGGVSAYISAPPSDFVLPFDLPNANLRGRFVRLNAVATRALSSHPLPEAAARLLAETLALDALLGSSLKLEGRVSVQLKGDGPLNMAVADFQAGGGLRAYARFDDTRTADLGAAPDFKTLVGGGILAITLEPKEGAANYQGMTALAPEGLARSAEAYFAQSEQLPTKLRLAAAPFYRADAAEKHGWSAGGLLIQALPGTPASALANSDDWARISLFLETLEAYELLDSSLPAEQVLWRLFHEDELRVQPAQPLYFQCSCSAEKVKPVLKSYGAEERGGLADADGIIRARCEFCGTTYEFPLDALDG